MTEDRYIEMSLEVNNVELDVEIKQGEGGMLPAYEGPYEVTPKVGEQGFETKYKTMTNDLTVLAVPYSEVSNPQGGTTVNIAYIL